MGIHIPDEGKALPPPNIVNRNSVWLGGVGWCIAMFQNGVLNRPPLKSGIHRQALWISIGWFLGYHLTKIENYTYAKRDHEMMEYVRHHPDDFEAQKKRTYAEVTETFVPVR